MTRVRTGSLCVQTAALVARFDEVRKAFEYEISCYSALEVDEQGHVTYPGWLCDSSSLLDVLGAAASPGLGATLAQACVTRALDSAMSLVGALQVLPTTSLSIYCRPLARAGSPGKSRRAGIMVMRFVSYGPSVIAGSSTDPKIT